MVSVRRLVICLLPWAFLAPATLASTAAAETKEQVDRHLRQVLQHAASLPPIRGQTLIAKETLPRFYEQRLYVRAWRDLTIADDLIGALRDAHTEGLDPADYHVDALVALRADIDRAYGLAATVPSLLADLDLLLTDAFLIYAGHLVSGRVDSETFDRNWLVKRREVDLVDLALNASSSSEPAATLRTLRPRAAGYVDQS